MDIFHRLLFRALDDDQLFNTVTLFCFTDEKRRTSFFTVDNRLRPRVFKLQTTLWFQERDHGEFSFHLNILDAQDGDSPSLVDNHLQWF